MPDGSLTVFVVIENLNLYQKIAKYHKLPRSNTQQRTYRKKERIATQEKKNFRKKIHFSRALDAQHSQLKSHSFGWIFIKFYNHIRRGDGGELVMRHKHSYEIDMITNAPSCNDRMLGVCNWISGLFDEKCLKHLMLLFPLFLSFLHKRRLDFSKSVKVNIRPFSYL